MKNITLVGSEIETADVRKFVTAREIVASLPLTKGVGDQLKVSTWAWIYRYSISRFINHISLKNMLRHLIHYHRVSVREGIDTEAYLPFMGADIKSETSKRCKHCRILFYINKNFNI